MKGYYAVIPATVRYDKSLKANAKLLYGEITALTNEKGYCWANNNYFAELYGVSKETVSRWISDLEKRGYVSTKLILDADTKAVKERRIYIDQRSIPLDENVNTLLTKTSIPLDENVNTPIDEKIKDNNTISFNTTVNTKVNKREDPSLFLDYPDLDKKVQDWIQYKKERKEPYKPMGLKSMYTQIKNKLDLYPEKSIIDLIETCMACGYKGIIWDKLDKANPKQASTSFLDIDF